VDLDVASTSEPPWRSDRRAARVVRTHAVLAGFGWIPLLVLLVLACGPEGWDVTRYDRWMEGGPTALAGGLVALAAVAAIPLSWPVLIAFAVTESDVAARIASGEPDGRRRAARVIGLHALCLLGVAAVAPTVADLTDQIVSNGWHEAAITRAWVVPAMLAGADLVLAGWLWRTAAATASASPPPTGRALAP
jgi:hypothetical protein